VIEAISTAAEILIVVPGTTKLEPIKHGHSHDTKVSAKVISVERIDHPTERQLLILCQKVFH